MNKNLSILALLIAVAVCVSGTYSQSSGDWVRFVTPEKTCSALMPGQPQKQVVTNDVANVGQVVTEMWLSKYERAIFLVGMTDYPVDITDQKKELDLDSDNFLKGVSATFTKETELTVSGHAAREFWGSSDTYDFASIVFMDGKRRVFQAAAGVPKDGDHNWLTKFLNSFEIPKS